MLQDQRMTVEGMTVDDLRAEYDDDLRDVLTRYDVETVAAEADVDTADLQAVEQGASPQISLADAAAVLAIDDGYPDAETIEAMACEHLLLGMSMAVLDVDALASEVDADLSAKEIQQKLERRAPMSLDEFVEIEYAIVGRQS